jgi:hypothetical protein
MIIKMQKDELEIKIITTGSIHETGGCEKRLDPFKARASQSQREWEERWERGGQSKQSDAESTLWRI